MLEVKTKQNKTINNNSKKMNVMWACILGFAEILEALASKQNSQRNAVYFLWILPLSTKNKITQIDDSLLWSFIRLRSSYFKTTQMFSITRSPKPNIFYPEKKEERTRKMGKLGMWGEREREKQDENLHFNFSCASYNLCDLRQVTCC